MESTGRLGTNAEEEGGTDFYYTVNFGNSSF